MNTEVNFSANNVNQEISSLPTGVEVNYTISLSLDYNFQGDVLQSKTKRLTLSCAANTLDIEGLNLPWGNKNLPWVNDRGFKFQSYDIQPNYGNAPRTFTQWTETYTLITPSEDDVFDVQERVEMPTWNIAFFEYNNPNLGSSRSQLPVDKRIRQVFGLKPIQGTISAKSLTPFSHDPYSFIGKTFDNFNGIINQARLTESVEDGVKVYELSIGWIGGQVGSADLPTYTI